MRLKVFVTVLLTILLSACATTEKNASMRPNTELPAEYIKVESNQWDIPPKRIKGKVPVYPITLMLSGVEGESVIEFTVGVDGITKDFKVHSTTDERYANHAIIALKDWIFEPAIKNGVPVEVTIRQAFSYDF